MGRDEQGVPDSAKRYKTIPRTLCFVCNGDDVLLLKGAPDKRLWANRLNGVGSHVEGKPHTHHAVPSTVVDGTNYPLT